MLALSPRGTPALSKSYRSICRSCALAPPSTRSAHACVRMHRRTHLYPGSKQGGGLLLTKGLAQGYVENVGVKDGVVVGLVATRHCAQTVRFMDARTLGSTRLWVHAQQIGATSTQRHQPATRLCGSGCLLPPGCFAARIRIAVCHLLPRAWGERPGSNVVSVLPG